MMKNQTDSTPPVEQEMPEGMFTDDAAPEAAEAVESTEAPEAIEAEVAESTEDTAVEAVAEEEKADDTEATSEPDKGNPGKKIESLNYEVRNLTKLVQSLIDKQGKPEEQQQKLEDLQQRADELAEADPSDFIDGTRHNALVREIKALRAEVAAARSTATTAASTASEARYWAEFDQANPEVKGQGQALFAEAQKIVAAQYGHLSDAERRGAASVVWNQVLTNAKSKGQATVASARTSTGKPTPAAKAASSKPSSTPPVRVTQRGASKAPVHSAVEDDLSMPTGMFSTDGD